MSTEPEPKPAISDDIQTETESEEAPEPTPEPPPPAPDLPPDPLVFEPATWYSVETVCLTADKGDGHPCPNLNVATTDPLVYSNAGQPNIVCGLCGMTRTILSASKLDPQPEMS